MHRIALVTGGTRGIGLGISRSLAREGWSLAVCDIRPESEVQEPLEELRSLGADVLYVQADISSTAERRRIVPQVQQRFGGLHLLVNNAGVAPRERKDLLDATEESYEWVMRTNLQGPFFLTQAAARWMVEQSRSSPGYNGCIVNITSISAVVASVNRGEYCMSKAGLAMAVRVFADRLAADGIPVFEVRPGIIRTDMTASVSGRYDAAIADGLVPQRRWGEPEDVARAVVALARGEFDYSTGLVVDVGGGLMMPRL